MNNLTTTATGFIRAGALLTLSFPRKPWKEVGAIVASIALTALTLNSLPCITATKIGAYLLAPLSLFSITLIASIALGLANSLSVRRYILQNQLESLPKRDIRFDHAPIRRILVDRMMSISSNLRALNGIDLANNFEVENRRSLITTGLSLCSAEQKRREQACHDLHLEMWQFLILCPSGAHQQQMLNEFAFLSNLVPPHHQEKTNTLLRRCQSAKSSAVDVKALVEFNLEDVKSTPFNEDFPPFLLDDPRQKYHYFKENLSTPITNLNFGSIVRDCFPSIDKERERELQGQVTQATQAAGMVLIMNHQYQSLSLEERYVLKALCPGAKPGLPPAPIPERGDLDIPDFAIVNKGNFLTIAAITVGVTLDKSLSAHFVSTLIQIDKEKFLSDGLYKALCNTQTIHEIKPLNIQLERSDLLTAQSLGARAAKAQIPYLFTNTIKSLVSFTL